MPRFSTFGQCAPGSGNHIMDIQGFGPLSISVQQWDDVDFCLGFLTRCATLGEYINPVVTSIAGVAQESVEVAVASGYVGTGAQLVFTHTVGGNGDLGKAGSWNLGGNPVVPGTVQVVDAGAVAPDLRDFDGDGILYTATTRVAAGTIDYDYGYVNLSYPTGSAPGTGATAINVACYKHTWITAYGSQLLTVATPQRDQIIRVRGLARGTAQASCRLRIECNFAW